MKHAGKGCKAGDEASRVSYIPISASAQGPSWCSSVPLSHQLVTTEGMGVTSGGMSSSGSPGQLLPGPTGQGEPCLSCLLLSLG